MKKIIYTLICVFAITSCQKEADNTDTDKTGFLTRTEVGIYNQSTPIVELDEENHQVCTSQELRYFGFQFDDQNMYAHFTMSAYPSAIGETITLTVSARGVKGVESNTYQVVAKKIEDGKFWLLHEPTQRGYIIPME